MFKSTYVTDEKWYRIISCHQMETDEGPDGPSVIGISTEVRLNDQVVGLLLQHQPTPNGEVTDGEADLFIRERDIPRFLSLVQENLWGVRVQEMEHNVPKLTKQLQEFKWLIQHGKQIAREERTKQEFLYQAFLRDNFWMFGLSYVSVRDRRRSSRHNIPDLLLQRADGFNVVELENPTDRLFVERSGRYEQSAELKEALAQIMDYVDDYAEKYRDHYYEDRLDTYKPKGIIVIGLRQQHLERRRRQLNSYLHGIEIWTYDDLIRNAERVIELLEQGPGTTS